MNILINDNEKFNFNINHVKKLNYKFQEGYITNSSLLQREVVHYVKISLY